MKRTFNSIRLTIRSLAFSMSVGTALAGSIQGCEGKQVEQTANPVTPSPVTPSPVTPSANAPNAPAADTATPGTPSPRAAGAGELAAAPDEVSDECLAELEQQERLTNLAAHAVRAFGRIDPKLYEVEPSTQKVRLRAGVAAAPGPQAAEERRSFDAALDSINSDLSARAVLARNVAEASKLCAKGPCSEKRRDIRLAAESTSVKEDRANATAERANAPETEANAADDAQRARDCTFVLPSGDSPSAELVQSFQALYRVPESKCVARSVAAERAVTATKASELALPNVMFTRALKKRRCDPCEICGTPGQYKDDGHGGLFCSSSC